LILGYNDIGPDGPKALAAAVKEHCKQMQSLSLEG
jgi:hypothetical protein